MEALLLIAIGSIIYYFTVTKKEFNEELKREGFADNIEKFNHSYKQSISRFEEKKAEVIKKYNLDNSYFEADNLMQIDNSPVKGNMDFAVKHALITRAKLRLEEYVEKLSIRSKLELINNFNFDVEIDDIEKNEILNLKSTLKSLKTKLQNLLEQKTEYINEIEEFNREYNLKLGEVIQSILNIKKEILYKKTAKQQKEKDKYKEDLETFEDTKGTIIELKKTISELNEHLNKLGKDDENYEEIFKAYQELKNELERLSDDLTLQEKVLKKTKVFIEDTRLQNEYKEIKNQYDDYTKEYQHAKEKQKDIFNLSADEKSELKKLFKQAARLCHPDIAPSELKEKSHELMQKLNHAYSKKDLAGIKRIFQSLENGIGLTTSSDSIDDKVILKEKITNYKKHIVDVEVEIDTIKQDNTYKTISTLDDWDTYFKVLKNKLEKEVQRLKEEAKSVLEESSDNDADEIISIIKEESLYAKHIQSIQNPSFEKIRRYCNNLVEDNKADAMQNDFAEYARMHKALMYDALEQFLERIDGQTISLIDWGCGQGIGSMLVLDYIREKQLDIKIDKVMLLDNDAEYLSRASLHVEVLKQNDIDIIALDVRNTKDIEKLNKLRNHLSLNLFVNDAMPLEYLDIDFDIFENAYFMCLSHESSHFVNEVYEGISGFINVQNMSIRNGKIGRFDKYERIFIIDNKDGISF